jgi:SAM-dependent methyltransferase
MLRKISRRLFFNLRYLGRPPWDSGVSPPELIRFLEGAVPGRALDVGCGTGTNLLTMAAYGWEVAGVDLAWLPILRARKRLTRAGVRARVVRGDVAGQMDLGATFDLVLDMGCYHSLGSADREAYRSNLAVWLKPGGVYLLYAHRQASPVDSHGVSEADFAGFLSALSLVWRQDSDELRPDGSLGHPATWAQFVKGAQRSL